MTVHQRTLTMLSLHDYPSVLRFCGSTKDLCNAMVIHNSICVEGMERDQYIGASLIETYLKCNAIREARILFSSLPEHSLFAWNLVIRSHRTLGEDEEAVQCLRRMHGEALIPEKYAFVSLISSHINLSDLAGIHRIHTHIVNGPYESDIVVGNSLINAYAKCGMIDEARTIFDKMVEHDSISWDTLIVACANSKLPEESFLLFRQQQLQGVLPTRITYIAIIDACAELRSSNINMILACIFGSEYENDVAVGTAMMNMFSKLDCPRDSWKIFCCMPERNLLTWNGILVACPQLHNKCSHEFYNQMLIEGVLPNGLTFIRMLSLCSSPSSLILGKHVHACIMGSEFVSEVAVHNALMNMYNKCFGLEGAWTVFESMAEKNEVSWTTIICTCVEHGQGMLAIAYFHQMLNEGTLPDKVLLICILDACASLHACGRARHIHACMKNMEFGSDVEVVSSLCMLYGKCGSFKDAMRVFDKIFDPDVKIWTALITSYAQHNETDKALQVFYQMQQESTFPNKITFFGAFDACAKGCALSEGRKFHVYVLSTGYDTDVQIDTALVDMYGKCGSLEESQKIFIHSFRNDIILLTAMMAACAVNNMVEYALDLFRKVCQTPMEPDEVTFINVLSMCSHAGLVEDGRLFFSSMIHDYNITPNIHHYSCMIDMLGRAGRLKEAEDMINEMQCRATSLQWIMLLTACRQNVDVERGERAAKKIFMLDPKNPIPYIELSNIYVSLNRDVDSVEIMQRMRELCV